MDSNPGSESTPQSSSARTPEPLHFTGSGAEYFGIWIVNLLLTIVTLGVYSAWAKVRRVEWFFLATEQAGAGFDFFVSPGRVPVGGGVGPVVVVALNYSVRPRSAPPLLIFF